MGGLAGERIQNDPLRMREPKGIGVACSPEMTSSLPDPRSRSFERKLRAGLSGSPLLGMPVPNENDANVRQAIELAFRSASRVESGRSVRFGDRRALRSPSTWGRLARGAVAAALVALVAWLSASLPFDTHSDARMSHIAARISSLAKQASDPSTISTDPKVRALLAAMVAMPRHRPNVSPPNDLDGGEFGVVDVYLDAVAELPICWLIELECSGALVGIEGGDAPFASAPEYDRFALGAGSIRIANAAGVTHLDGAGDSATGGSRRIASLMMQFPSGEREERGPCDILEVSGIDAAGRRIQLSVRCVERSPNGEVQ
jgi:hypothetical protein